LLSDEVYPRLQLIYGGADAFREPLEVDVETYIGVKSFKAKGKRLTTCAVERIEELTPLRYPAPEDPIEEVAEDDSVVDDENPQLSLF
jgi:topoisomerase-4 subunit A